MASESNILTARQLIKRHRDPAQAFRAASAGGTSIDIKSARQVLQGLTGVTLTPVEMLALSKKYGDGKASMDYQRFLADQNLAKGMPEPRVQPEMLSAATPSSIVSARTPTHATRAATPRRERGEAPLGRSVATHLTLPGIDKEGDRAVLEQSDTRLLSFSSDSMSVVPLIDGKSPAPVVATMSNTSSMRPRMTMDMQRRAAEYSVEQAAVIGSDVPELHRRQHSRLDELRNFSSLEGGAATGKLADPLYHTGRIAESGNIGGYINDIDSGQPPSPGYLPVFPGDDFAKRRPRDEKVYHSGPITSRGGIGSFVTDESWHTEQPAGYLAPLPNAPDPEMPRLAVSDPMHTHGQLLEIGGVGGWNHDLPGYLESIDALKQLHTDPLYHSGVIKVSGGLEGFAGDETTWLQRVPLQAKQSVVSPYQYARALSAGRGDRPGKGTGSARRKSIPDLAVATPTKAALYGTNRSDDGSVPYSDNLDDLVPVGSPHLAAFLSGQGDVDMSSGDFAVTGKPISGVARTHHELRMSHIADVTPGFGPSATVERTHAVAGPITDVYGLHHKSLSYAFGARSPTAIALAASPMVKFDINRLAQVRRAMRDKLPEKEGAAGAVLRSSLSKLDGDGDGRLTEAELMSGLGKVFPDLDAASVGMLVKYFRHKRVQKAKVADANGAGGGGDTARSDASGSSAGGVSRDSRASANTVPLLSQPVDASQLPTTRKLKGMLDTAPSRPDADSSRENAPSTGGFGTGIDVREIADWVLKQQGGVEEVLSPLALAGPAGNITAIPGWGSPPKSHPGPTEPGSARPISHLVPAPKGSLTATDSAAITAVLMDTTTGTQHGSGLDDDVRAPGAGSLPHASLANDDPATMFTSYTLGSGTAAIKAKTASYSEMHKRRAVHSHASEFRRGDAGAPAAGVSLTGRRAKDVGEEGDDDSPVDRTEWATRNAKFEAFRVKWEASHGKAAMKEMQLDAQQPAEGPTWTRAQPVPFKVLHVKGGPQTSGSS